MRGLRLIPALLIIVAWSTESLPAEQTELNIYPAWTHVRSVAEREWSSFPEKQPLERLNCEFEANAMDEDGTLTLRQCDVRETWTVTLNDILLGRLTRDENDQLTDFLIPGGTLIPGKNKLEIEQTGKLTADDIRVGRISLRWEAPAALRQAARIEIELNDSQGKKLPGRITLVNQDGTLVPIGAISDHQAAVRSGVLYTASGSAAFGVSAGQYTLHAGRGMEYSVASFPIDIQAGQTISKKVVLERTVNTEGWIACDTHIHTLTHSGHGDATIEERIITLAGECIELPIATDHNTHIDYEPIAKQLATRAYFTPVIGNEVTTSRGHFNIFPIQSAAAKPDASITDWRKLREEMFSVPRVRVAILNHGRDIHSGFRPFSPRHHVSISGERLDDSVLPINAMELINSGAVQTDPMQLFADWCGLINRGLSVTPVGSSDSHDVTRYIVGQGRTYIRCNDTNVSAIDVDAAIQAFVDGRVVVSYGMFVDVRVNDRVGPGEFTSLGTKDLNVKADVRFPAWVNPSRAELYANGRLHQIAERPLASTKSATGQVWTVDWTIPRDTLQHDLWLTVVVRGDGVHAAFWPTAKPYQPDSLEFTPYTFACTGAIKVDVDGDNSFQSANDYAQSIVEEAAGNLPVVFDRLESYGSAVAVQTASVLYNAGTDPESLAQHADRASDSTRDAVHQYLRARRDSEISRLEQQE